MNRCGDVAIDHFQAIVAVNGSRLIGEAEFVKRTVKPIPRTIPGENPSSPVPAVSGRGQSDNEEACGGGTETRDGLSPILPITKSPDFDPGDLLSIFN